MTDLDIKRVDGAAGDEELEAWRHVHNTIIPAHLLSLDDVRERAVRNHLELAHADGVLVGNSTVRPPEGDDATAMVIARVLAEHRRRGFGEQLYERAVRRARDLGARTIETCVLSSNEDGLRFALEQAPTERFARAEERYRGPDRGSFVSGLPEGDTWFRVRAIDEEGRAGAWSAPMRIEVAYPSPTLVARLFALGAAVLGCTVLAVALGHRRARRNA